MCHPDSIAIFPKIKTAELKKFSQLKCWDYSAEKSNGKVIAIISDIYGCNDFYRGLSAYFVEQGWRVLLIDLFVDLGELPEVTKEAAFARRHKIKDKSACDQIEEFLLEQKIDSLVGFCLGGNFVLEMAKRNVQSNLIAFYPFPAGLPNQEPLQPSLEYLEQNEKRVLVLLGSEDDGAGRDNVAIIANMAKTSETLLVNVYKNSGHGFLANLNNQSDLILQAEANEALHACISEAER